ncbi:NADPH dependent preQ0 reductase [Klebsiella pneumoniae subsp. rhinoscleromatis]|nr:NADPH dependent preQ0 reductase [Klebsiella pneumoniae subsp. rhinoscleromatis]
MLRKNGETQCFISGPQESFWLVQTDNINSRCLESQIEKHLLACLPQGVKDITITLRPESINGDSYHYSHGTEKTPRKLPENSAWASLCDQNFCGW